jgi:hypothetical protein
MMLCFHNSFPQGGRQDIESRCTYLIETRFTPVNHTKVTAFALAGLNVG